MALLFMDSFDHYATADIAEKWTQICTEVYLSGDNPIIGSYGRNGSQAVRTQVLNGSLYAARPLGITLAPADATCIVGLACKYSVMSNLEQVPDPRICAGGDANMGSNWIIAIRDTNTYQVWFRVNTNGTITCLRGDAGSSVELGTTTGSLQAGVFAYVEVKVVIHNSTGSVSVRINGVESLTLTNQDTQTSANAAWNEVRVGYHSQAAAPWPTLDIDDVVVMDGSGSYNNAFIGDVTISILKPNGAGNSTDWTPSAGSNYQCVDEALVNDDTDYVSSNTLNAKDLYAMEDCAAGADIRAVQVVTAMRKATEGPGKMKHVIRSNSVDYDSAEFSLGGTAYSFNRTIWETDPATAAAWTESGWNAAQVGVKKTG